MFGRSYKPPAGFVVPCLMATLFLPLSASDGAAPVVMTPRERSLAAQSFVTEKLWIWQKRLKLQSWNISVLMCAPADLKPRTLGNIHWDADKKSEVIRVLDSAHYHVPSQEMLEDMEFTVVHELIHLELSSLPRSDASRSAEEHAVNQIAEALLRLDRR
jgi:hypothetical protein